jgi:hypothetical protein
MKNALVPATTFFLMNPSQDARHEMSRRPGTFLAPDAGLGLGRIAARLRRGDIGRSDSGGRRRIIAVKDLTVSRLDPHGVHDGKLIEQLPRGRADGRGDTCFVIERER